MGHIRLTGTEVEGIKGIIAHEDHAWRLRRALAILWLCQGDSPRQVARRLCVSRATVYNWSARFQERCSLDLAARVGDATRPGRPPSRRERSA
jgi:transposase